MTEEVVQHLKERMQTDLAFRRELLLSPRHMLQDYPLSEEEKLQFVLPNFSWLIEGQLAGSAYPFSEDALALLHTLGIRVLLTLSVEPLSPALLEKYALHCEHLPLADFTAPTLEQVTQAIALLNELHSQSIPVVVHCGAGLGRTGTILTCYLVAQGHTAPTAIAQVRALRPGSIETPEQEEVIAAYERFLASQ